MVKVISLEKDNSDMCNSCHSREPKELIEVYVGYNNSGIGIRLCKECAEDLCQKVNQAINRE